MAGQVLNVVSTVYNSDGSIVVDATTAVAVFGSVDAEDPIMGYVSADLVAQTAHVIIAGSLLNVGDAGALTAQLATWQNELADAVAVGPIVSLPGPVTDIDIPFLAIFIAALPQTVGNLAVLLTDTGGTDATSVFIDSAICFVTD